MLASTGNKPASSAKAYELVHTQHLRGAKPMSTPGQAEGSTKPIRLLVPVNADENSHWAIQYALQRRLEGAQVEVILLNVGEPIVQWEVLRFRTQQEIEQFQSERAQTFIEEASALLAHDDIPCRGFFKQGELVFTILDTAEEFDCDEIVMPAANTWLPDLFSRGVVSRAQRRQRGIPVVVVNSAGVADKTGKDLQ